jgi:hypothetical protein
LLNLLWLLLGVSALIVALTLGWLLLRVGRTLTSVEELLETTTEGLQHTLPEMTQTIGNVNAITAGLNVGLHAAARGASRAGDNVRATWYGVKVASRSLWRSYMDGTGEMPEKTRAASAGPRGGSGSGE